MNLITPAGLVATSSDVSVDAVVDLLNADKKRAEPGGF